MFEDEIRLELHQYAESHPFPDELDERIKRSYYSEMEKTRYLHNRIKKRWISAIAACTAIIVPSTVFANHLLSEDIYGPFSALQKAVKTFTMEEYSVLGAKLSGAQKDLGSSEFQKFASLLKQEAKEKVEYGDSYGNIDYSTFSPDELASEKRLLADLQPYFDKLNHIKSSQNVLTPNEFDSYIEAQMTVSTVMAKAHVDANKGRVDVNALPQDLRTEYQQAESVIAQVAEETKP